MLFFFGPEFTQYAWEGGGGEILKCSHTCFREPRVSVGDLEHFKVITDTIGPLLTQQ